VIGKRITVLGQRRIARNEPRDQDQAAGQAQTRFTIDTAAGAAIGPLQGADVMRFAACD